MQNQHKTDQNRYCPPSRYKQHYCPLYKTTPRLTGTQTSNATPHIRTLLYTHYGITAHGFILGKTARRICTGALLHQKVWPPSKGLCVPPEGAPTLLEGELASDINCCKSLNTFICAIFSKTFFHQAKQFVCCLIR
jgi:hypothetical protein